MSAPRLLDLFCGAGGAAMGYHRAGFDVVGVDIEPQPHYPFEFHQADAMSVLAEVASWRGICEGSYRRAGVGNLRASYADSFAVIHASPPCQFATAYRRRHGVALDAVNLIPETRKQLVATGLPYVIENVEQARPHLVDPIRLCGSSFGLDVRRHRLFECSFPVLERGCDHGWQTPRFPQATNRKNLRSTVEVGSWRCADIAPVAMGIDWMTNDELSQAIPPAYTEFIGEQLLSQIAPAELMEKPQQ